MRVLHLSSGNLYGGIETMLVTLARHRHECPQLEPEIGLAFEGRVSRELMETGVPVHILGEVRASRPHTVMKARARLGALLRRVPFDVVICHAPWPHAVFGPAVQKSRIPLVFWAHNDCNGRHWIERWAGRTSPALGICNSRYTADTVPTMFPGVPLVVVRYPVSMLPAGDTEMSDCIRRELKTPTDAVVLLQVSRLNPWKGQSSLVEALGLLAGRQDWVCWIVGYPQSPADVRYRDAIHGRARELGVYGRIRFVERTDDVRPLFGAADIYCQPNSAPEPFGITFVEAMLAGLPVVSTNVGGPSEFIDRTCGVLVAPGAPSELATHLAALLDRAEFRRSMGDAGAKRAHEMFEPASQLSCLEKALAPLVSATPARPS